MTIATMKWKILRKPSICGMGPNDWVTSRTLLIPYVLEGSCKLFALGTVPCFSDPSIFFLDERSHSLSIAFFRSQVRWHQKWKLKRKNVSRKGKKRRRKLRGKELRYAVSWFTRLLNVKGMISKSQLQHSRMRFLRNLKTQIAVLKFIYFGYRNSGNEVTWKSPIV